MKKYLRNLFRPGSVPAKKASRAGSSGRSNSGDYEIDGESSIQRLVDAAFEEGWLSKILLIVWTAGPVTAIALLFAYWLINGKMPPVNLLFYFGVFTGLSSLLTILTNFFLRVRQEQRKANAQQSLLWAIGGLTDFVLAVRNEYLESLGSKSGRFQSALYLLQDPDSNPDSIETAVEDLTGNRDMSQRFRRLESYRKKGLSPHVRDESASIVEHFETELNAIAEQAPEAYHYLSLRLNGKIPSKKLGKVRKKQFLKNIADAQAIDNPDLVDLRDTEELLKLTLELLAGRSYLVAKWKAFGFHPLAAAMRKREQAAYWLLQLRKKRAELVGIITRYLKDSGQFPELRLFNGSRFENENLPKLKEAVEQLKAKAAAAGSGGKAVIAKEDFRNLVYSLQDLEELTPEFEKAKSKLKVAREQFWEHRKKYGKIFPLKFYKSRPPQGSGVYFQRDKLRLSERQKIELTRRIKSIFQNFTADEDLSLLGERNREYELDNLLGAEDIKLLTLEIFDVINEFVDLRRPSIREAIEVSNSFYLGLVETGLSRRAKYGWIIALAEEIEERPNLVMLRTIERLLNTFEAELSPQGIEFLSQALNIPRERLEEALAG